MSDVVETERDSFMRIENGVYRIGVSESTIHRAMKRVTGSVVTADYLYHSFPVHSVALESVYIGRRLVTVEEFERFVAATDYRTEAEREGWGWILDTVWVKRDNVSWRKPFGDAADTVYREYKGIVPVLQVTWNDCVAYCAWVSSLSSVRARLLAEFEWEVFAGKCGVESLKTFVEREKKPSSSLEYMQWILELLTENGSVLPGVVWEWCDDWFDRYPGGVHNDEFGSVYKVLRGGSLLSHPAQRTREYRFRRCPTARSAYYGFRLLIE